jgi:uncharacterized Ntn-hydrolase superfamily protein
MCHDPSLEFQTYSIVARDGKTGELGVAVQTHQMCVGVAVPWLAPGVGAIATQASTNIRFGPMGLDLLGQGLAAEKVMHALIATDAGAKSRQLAIVDQEGGAAAWTGEQCIPFAGHMIGAGFSVQANMMLRTGVVEAMAEAYVHAQGEFSQRLLSTLKIAQEIGGDIRGMQSAALKIVASEAFDQDGLAQVLPRYDLRVDEHTDPLAELERLARLRSASLHSQRGMAALQAGKQKMALSLWEEARAMAPELEELAFWQAINLADKHSEYPGAAKILKPVLDHQANRRDWIDLIKRLQQCGFLENEGTAEYLLQAINA